MIKSLLTEKYKTANKKLILLDYDGTLVKFEPTPERARPSDGLLSILNKLARLPNTKVVIVSGRRSNDIDNFFGELPIDIIAEHGAMAKINGAWKRQISADSTWKLSLLPIFNRITLTCSNSFVEEKEFSLTWHYRNADRDAGYSHSRELISAVQKVVSSANLRTLDGDKIVEVASNEVNKGRAVDKLLTQDHYDYILAIGDDRTDEDMFTVLAANENAFTVKVGPSHTAAKHRLPSVEEVITLLQQLVLSEN